MKKNLFLLFFSAIFSITQAQTAKKFILLEHLTNSRCSVCASKNPGFYNTISNYENDVHHIAYHPPVPYNNCIFYLDNPVENAARGDYYGIEGAPSLFINGVAAPGGSQLVTAATLDANLGLFSPLQIVVSETGDLNRTASIQVKTVGNVVPAGNLRLFVAIVEKIVNYDAPNGEDVHHDVFRKMLPDITGAPFTAAAAGAEINVSYNYTVENDWNAGEIYVVAFVQNIDTKEVINSGTRFDESTSGTPQPETAQINIYPNPANGDCFVDLTNLQGDSKTIRISNIAGQLIYTLETNETIVKIPSGNFAKGLYFVEAGGKVVKLITN